MVEEEAHPVPELMAEIIEHDHKEVGLRQALTRGHQRKTRIESRGEDRPESAYHWTRKSKTPSARDN